MNSNAGGNHHRAIFAVAAWFSISARAKDMPTFQPRFLNHPVRRLQSFCPMESTGLSTARANLEEDLAAARNACTTPPCFIDVADMEGYNDLLEACEAARGAFHVGSVDITCSATYEVVNMPECFESASQDATCTTDVFEDYIAIVWDFDECTEVATHTNTTDFSGSSTSSCLVDSSIVDTARRILATEVLADANACTNSPCVFNVETYPEYSAMVDACESARGVFHVFSVVVTCVSRTLQFNDYPDCFIRESLDPDCTESFPETYMEILWNNEGCTESATHTAMIDFHSPGPTAAMPTDPPAFPTDPPAYPSDPPAFLTDPPTNECILPADGVHSASEDLVNEVRTSIEDCPSSPCTIEVGGAQTYSDLLDACKEAKGAFHVYTVEVLCSRVTFEFNKFPACGVSANSNSVCDPDHYADMLELVFDADNCTETATLTGTTDFFTGESDDPDASETPIGTPIGTDTTAVPTSLPQALPTPSPKDTPTPLQASSARGLSAQKNSCGIILALTISLACAAWI
jgi:hypothetical protein